MDLPPIIPPSGRVFIETFHSYTVLSAGIPTTEKYATQNALLNMCEFGFFRQISPESAKTIFGRRIARSGLDQTHHIFLEFAG
jgi:hypothetical protein